MAEKEYIEREAIKSKKIYSEERHEYVVPVAEIDWMVSADVAPVRYGQWVDCNEESAGCCSEAVHCSLCGEEAPISASDYYCRGGKIRYEIAPFCPNCGAKMDGGVGE